jgi:hypothetical protein
MKESFVVILLLSSSIKLYAQLSDPFGSVWKDIFKNNPGTIASVIGLFIFWVVIVPLYKSFTLKEHNNPTKTAMAECVVTETTMQVLSQAEYNARIICELKVGELFYLVVDTEEFVFREVQLVNGITGYITNLSKYKRQLK